MGDPASRQRLCFYASAAPELSSTPCFPQSAREGEVVDPERRLRHGPGIAESALPRRSIRRRSIRRAAPYSRVVPCSAPPSSVSLPLNTSGARRSVAEDKEVDAGKLGAGRSAAEGEPGRPWALCVVARLAVGRVPALV
jgi:hypothetical protein